MAEEAEAWEVEERGAWVAQFSFPEGDVVGDLVGVEGVLGAEDSGDSGVACPVVEGQAALGKLGSRGRTSDSRGLSPQRISDYAFIGSILAFS